MIKQPKPSCLSIIIPALNEEHYINRCLEAIKKMNTENMDLEIIVVDNGSTDKTVEISKSYGVKVLIKQEGTIASLRNYGAINSRGEFIAFLDADCIVPEDWFEKALIYLQHDRVIVGFRMTIPKNSNWVARCWDLLFSRRYITTEVEWVPSGNMLIARETFMSIGGFKESLETNEDIDLCFRLRSNGYKVISSSETVLIHLRPPRSLKELFTKELWHGKEVFREFICDMRMRKDSNILKIKNIKVVFYAGFYLICIFLIMFSLFLSLIYKTVLPLFLAFFLPIFISFLLALKYAKEVGRNNLILGMTILLIIYGTSRAVGLLLLMLKKFDNG